jgi:hypothetical protein
MAVVTATFAVQRARPAAAPPPPDPVVAISLNSVPQGAQVTNATGASLGVTPLVIMLPRSTAAVEHTLRKEGFRPTPIQLTPERDQPALVVLEPVPPSARPASTRWRSRMPVTKIGTRP